MQVHVKGFKRIKTHETPSKQEDRLIKFCEGKPGKMNKKVLIC